MSPFVAITTYTFREAVRNKVLYSIFFVAIILFLLATIMGSASLAQDERILKDVGLMVLSVFCDMVAIFVGVTMLYNELERKTVYNLLSKPITRATYFLGKYSGMLLTLGVQLGMMAVVLTAIMFFRGDATPITYFQALWLIWVQVMVVASIAVFFSSFSTPYVSGFMTFGLWLVANLIQELEGYLPGVEAPGAHAILKGVVLVMPDFNLLRITTQLTYEIDVPWSYVAQSSAYALAYAAAFLTAGVLIFQRRDFI